MDKETKSYIETKLAPLLQKGELALFLGAGVSIGAPTINNKGIPSSPDLIKRICLASGYSEEDAKSIDLQTAFAFGEKKIDNFDNFLLSNFKVTKAFQWQIDVFKNWWRAVFTTNIDDMTDRCVEQLKLSSKSYPNYTNYNYKERAPVIPLPINPPIAFLHGSINSLKDGFVFDRLSYADNTVFMSDWIRLAALNIAQGHCVLVGSRFKESDIEAAMRQRKVWDNDSEFNKPNWIALKSFSKVEKETYEMNGFFTIQAEAEEFFSFLCSCVKYLSPEKFIRRMIPHLDSRDNESTAWFADNFEHVATQLEKAQNKRGVFSQLYQGDSPNWFYIVNNAPAKFPYFYKLVAEVNELSESKSKAKVIALIGPLGSGKTTLAMQVMGELAKEHKSVYSFYGLNGIDIEKLWNSIKDSKGLVVLFFDSASEHFYAINQIASRVFSRSTAAKVCFIIEERKLNFDRNKRHLLDVPRDSMIVEKLPRLSAKEADILITKAADLGLKFEKLDGLKREEAIEKIIGFEKGYRGDLLATLYELSHRMSYKDKLNEEYYEIQPSLAMEVYQTISLVTAARLSIPITYLAETHELSPNKLIKLLKENLEGKILYNGLSTSISSRHHSIAEFHIKNLVSKEEAKVRIISLMKCLSTKFTIEDIRKHPISYRIYREILSFRFLTETLFKKIDYSHIHEIYSTCQNMFSDDAIFWLQYGRFMVRDRNLDGALHCFRKGLGLYDSFQIRHALGQTLLKKYQRDGLKDKECFDEGFNLLMTEINIRGENDPYAYTALGHELIQILKRTPDDEELKSTLKDIINRGIKYFQDDDMFMKMFGNYLAVVNEPEIK